MKCPTWWAVSQNYGDTQNDGKDGFSSPLSSDAWNITLLPTSSDFYLKISIPPKKLLQWKTMNRRLTSFSKTWIFRFTDFFFEARFLSMLPQPRGTNIPGNQAISLCTRSRGTQKLGTYNRPGWTCRIWSFFLEKKPFSTIDSILFNFNHHLRCFDRGQGALSPVSLSMYQDRQSLRIKASSCAELRLESGTHLGKRSLVLEVPVSFHRASKKSIRYDQISRLSRYDIIYPPTPR